MIVVASKELLESSYLLYACPGKHVSALPQKPKMRQTNEIFHWTNTTKQHPTGYKNRNCGFHRKLMSTQQWIP